ncbi:hypothetical protein GC170_00525 [bacterium]|nr:hypothetical protein [bacterium]
MNRAIAEVLTNFMDSCGREYEFPAGGEVALLTRQESALFEALSDTDDSLDENLRTISNELDWSDLYSIAIFGVRLGILGVRTGNARTYHLGLIAFLAACTKLDWRDTLGALAIFEDCGRRLGIGLRSVIERIAIPGDDRQLQSLLDGYFSREERMRSVEVMGLKRAGEGDDLTFVPIGMIESN